MLQAQTSLLTCSLSGAGNAEWILKWHSQSSERFLISFFEFCLRSLAHDLWRRKIKLQQTLARVLKAAVTVALRRRLASPRTEALLSSKATADVLFSETTAYKKRWQVSYEFMVRGFLAAETFPLHHSAISHCTTLLVRICVQQNICFPSTISARLITCELAFQDQCAEYLCRQSWCHTSCGPLGWIKVIISRVWSLFGF